MELLDFIDSDLSGIEEQLAHQLSRISPDGQFVEDLRGRLVSSRIFEYRRSIGAILVASLSVIFAGTLVYSIGKLAKRTAKAVTK